MGSPKSAIFGHGLVSPRLEVWVGGMCISRLPIQSFVWDAEGIDSGTPAFFMNRPGVLC